MIAFLGMYDMPEMHTANNRFWHLIRNHLGFGPDTLSRGLDPWEIWRSPDLLLGQTCGMPFRTRLHRDVALIGTPDYGVPGCPPGFYRSVLVVRTDDTGDTPRDFSGRRFAYNEALSQSGWAAPMNDLSAQGITFGTHVKTGAHAASARAVADNQADIAALDAVTWALLQRYQPITRHLRVIAQTPPTPGLPLITAKHRDAQAIATAVRAAIADLSSEDSETLRIRGLVDIPASAYLAVPNPPAP